MFFKEKYELLLPTHDELNVSREDAVKAYIDEYQPDIVLHCAALSNTGYCQHHPDESHRVNVQGTVKLAKACKQTGAKFIFMSSDQVYNGTPVPGFLKEEDVLQPVNVYGLHKLEAEQRTLWNLPQAVGLRLTWLYDLPNSPLKLNSNLLVNLHKAYNEGVPIKVATHEFRGVTNVWEVVRNMEKVFSLPGGIYNFGSNNSLNSFSLHLKVAVLMGLKEPSSWILPDEDKFSDLERNLTMDCTLIGNYGICFPDSVKGIEGALERPFRL